VVDDFNGTFGGGSVHTDGNDTCGTARDVDEVLLYHCYYSGNCYPILMQLMIQVSARHHRLGSSLLHLQVSRLQLLPQ
jgi:hypothetical protein